MAHTTESSRIEASSDRRPEASEVLRRLITSHVDSQKCFGKTGSWGHIWQSVAMMVALPILTVALVLALDVRAATSAVEWQVFVALLAAQSALWGIVWGRLGEWQRQIASLSVADPSEDRRRPRSPNPAKWPYRFQAAAGAAGAALTVTALAVGSILIVDREDWRPLTLVSALLLTVIASPAWYRAVLALRGIYVTTRLPAFSPCSVDVKIYREGIGSVVWAYKLLSARLRNLLSVLGVMIGLLVVTAGAAIKVENVCRIDPNEEALVRLRRIRGLCSAELVDDMAVTIPSEVVLFFGLALTMILAAIYLPTHARVAELPTLIVDRYFSLDRHQGALSKWDPSQALELRESFAREIGSQPTGVDAIQGGIVVLAPLLAGIGTQFIAI